MLCFTPAWASLPDIYILHPQLASFFLSAAILNSTWDLQPCWSLFVSSAIKNLKDSAVKAGLSSTFHRTECQIYGLLVAMVLICHDLKVRSWGCREGSAVRKTICLSRGAGFSSQHLHRGSEPAGKSRSRRHGPLVWHPWTPGMLETHFHMSGKHIHTWKKKNK